MFVGSGDEDAQGRTSIFEKLVEKVGSEKAFSQSNLRDQARDLMKCSPLPLSHRYNPAVKLADDYYASSRLVTKKRFKLGNDISASRWMTWKSDSDLTIQKRKQHHVVLGWERDATRPVLA